MDVFKYTGVGFIIYSANKQYKKRQAKKLQQEADLAQGNADRYYDWAAGKPAEMDYIRYSTINRRRS